ncbi:MAG: VWA domain-containing protein, partial [Candidatus Acidiferrales bacterium]
RMFHRIGQSTEQERIPHVAEDGKREIQMKRAMAVAGIALLAGAAALVGTHARAEAPQQAAGQQNGTQQTGQNGNANPPAEQTPQATTGSSSPTTAEGEASGPALHVGPGQVAKPATGGQGQGQTRGHKIIVTANVVLVPVTVKDRSGQLVGDLQQQDFRIIADNVEQQVLYFSADPVPLSAVVLIDNDLTQKQAQQVQKSLTAIAAGLGQGDEAAIVTYDQFPTTVADFSFNNDLVYKQLKRLELGSHFPNIMTGPGSGPIGAGPTVNGQSQATGVPTIGASSSGTTKDMDDAIFAAADMLKGRGRDRRKIIFLITDGNNSRHNEHSFDQTMQLLLENEVSVYSISVGHALMQKQTGRLERYAQDSGGDTFYAGNAADLGRLYPEVTEQARNQYTLTFQPDDLAKDKDYHQIEVRVRRPELTILTREGFYMSAVAGK